MTVMINNYLNKNVMDFLILQTIAECKLDRELNNYDETDPTVRFYNSYKNVGFTQENIDRFKVAVGYAPNLAEMDNLNQIEGYIPETKIYEGGAGLYTKLPEQQIDYFIDNFVILDYHGNDNTGFSATVFEDLRTGVKTISFRSTEFSEDYSRDATADSEITFGGTAFGQVSSMIKYIEELKLKGVISYNDTLNVTGYSLGSHIASNFYKMYENELNINNLYSFNGPGVGNLESPYNGNAYVELKNDLKNFNLIIDVIKLIKDDLILNELEVNLINSQDFVSNLTNINNQQKTLINNYLAFTTGVAQFDTIINSQFIGGYLTSTVENELSKGLSINGSQIYNTTFYNSFVNYLSNKYQASNAGWSGNLVSSSFYGNSATFIAGIAAPTNSEVLPSDYQVVANSNIYANPVDIIIEDRSELENVSSYLKFWASNKPRGDFLNTHSLTLLNKSLSLMAFLAEAEGTNYINVSKYTGLISSLSAEKAYHLIADDSGISNNNGDSNSTASIVNALYKLFYPLDSFHDDDVIFENTIEGWSDIHKIQEVERRQAKILEAVIMSGSSLQIESFYDLTIDDLDINNSNGYVYKTKEDLYEKVMLDNEEGQAYRYAIEKLNPFVVRGVDYSTKDFNSFEIKGHTEQWYKARIDIVLAITKANTQNTSDYISNKNIYVDDQYQGLRFYTAGLSPLQYALGGGVLSEMNIFHELTNDKNDLYYESWTKYLHTNQKYLMNASSDPSTIISSITDKINAQTELRILPEDMLFSDKNIFYINPLSSSYESKIKGNEWVFIKPDKVAIDFMIANGNLNPALNELERLDSKKEVKERNYYVDGTYVTQMTSIVSLGDGDDYIEIISPESYAEISSTKGKKTYYLQTQETTIIDNDKTGTIYLDGIELKGGNRVTINTLEQTENIEGINHTIRYKINFETKMLTITHVETGNKIYIKDMVDFGNGTAFGFENKGMTASIKSLTLTKFNFINPDAEEYLEIDVPIIEASYLNIEDFQSALTIYSGILDTKDIHFQSGTDLIVYDSSEPSHKVRIKGYFNNNGTIKQYTSEIFSHVVKNSDDTFTPIYYPQNASIKIADINVNSYNIPTYISTTDSSVTIIHYTPDYFYEINPNIFDSKHIEKNGNDLIITASNRRNDSTIIKNYFAFDHSLHTYLTSDGVEISASAIENYFKLMLSDANDSYIMSLTSPLNISPGLGDDKVIGTIRNEIFKSTGMFQASSNEMYNDGNDIFTGGGGQDKFVFSNASGKDIITDFGIDDLIYLGNSVLGPSYRRENNNLILNESLTINNYFLNVNFKVDSRIFLSDETTKLVFDESLINSFSIKQIEGLDYFQENLNPLLSANNHKTIIGNMDNNNITVTRNNSIIKQPVNFTNFNDGNDKIIINVTEQRANIASRADTESNLNELPEEDNVFRVQIEFGIKGGNDILENASFKEEGEYGDIIVLKDLNATSISFKKKIENNQLKHITMFISDGSSLTFNIEENTPENAQVIKIGEEILTLADIIDAEDSALYNGDVLNNLMDYSSYLTMNNEIHGKKGNDIIKSGNGDDSISGDEGFDEIYLSSGKDEYLFTVNSDIDTFYFKNIREKLNVTFVIDSLYNEEDIKYSYDDLNGRIYLSFSENNGVIFENANWNDFLYIQDGLTIKYDNDTIITPPYEVSIVEEMPFTPIAKILEGTNSANTINTDPTYNNLVFSKNGNDTIISQGSDHNVSLLFGGTGNDDITANKRDIVTVRTGDGTDTITSNSNDYLISILRNNSIVNNGEEKLFDLSVTNTNDLTLRYGGTSDKLVLKDFFLNETDISVSIFENNHNKTETYYITEILDSLNLTKNALQSAGVTTINRSDVDYDEESDIGKIIGGEIAYSYLNTGSAYTDQSEASVLLHGMSQGNLYLNKN